jgi:hypothetical protein
MYRTIFALHEVQKLWSESVAELVQCRLQLLAVDRAGSVSIEMKEDALPVLCPFVRTPEKARDDRVGHTLIYFHRPAN